MEILWKNIERGIFASSVKFPQEAKILMDKGTKLTPPALDKVRDIAGFPKGTDDDIIALSDPPNYTACPNPFVEEFIREHGKPYDEATYDYQREPFTADVSEGKNDPIYNAHSYHTKVPYKAIMRYILHYTKPGSLRRLLRHGHDGRRRADVRC